MTPERPWWDGSDELRRYRENEQAEQQAHMTTEEGRRFVRQISGGLARSIGWGLGRRLLAAILGRG